MSSKESGTTGPGVGRYVAFSEAPPPARRTPRQDRSREMVRAIVEAAQRLLEEGGDLERVTTHGIAERAGADIKSLYRYFPNKDAIFAEVFEERLRADGEHLRASWGSPRDLARQPIDSLFRMLVLRVLDRHVDLLELHPEFYRRYFRQFALVDRCTGQEGSWEELLEARLARLLDANAHRLDVGDPERAAFFVMRILHASIQGAIARDPALLRDAEHREETVLAVLRYLGHDPGRKPASRE